MKKDKTSKQNKVQSENIYQPDVPAEKAEMDIDNKQGHLSGY